MGKSIWPCLEAVRTGEVKTKRESKFRSFFVLHCSDFYVEKYRNLPYILLLLQQTNNTISALFCIYRRNHFIYRRFGNIRHTYTVRNCSPKASKCLWGAVSFYFFFCTGNQISSCASSCLSA